MTVYDSELWRDDLDRVMARLPDLEKLEGKSLMVTGAAGLICSSVADIIFRYNDTHPGKSPIRLLAAGRWLEEMSGRFGDMVKRPDFTFVKYDAAKSDNNLEASVSCDYIIHGASNAFPEMIVKEPVETMLANFLGIRELLEFARTRGVKRLLYISSSEVYGKKEGNQPFRENEYGAVDPLSPRNSYAEGKRAAETLCASYAAEYGVESVIIRPGHIYGPTASPHDNRVSSAWAWAAARGENLVMKSDGAQLRSYCYCLDCASAMLTALLRGESGRAFNISNPDSVISIREMGTLLAEAGGVNLVREEAGEQDKKGFNPMSNSSLEAGSLLAMGWRGEFGAREGLEHTVRILRELEKGSGNEQT